MSEWATFLFPSPPPFSLCSTPWCKTPEGWERVAERPQLPFRSTCCLPGTMLGAEAQGGPVICSWSMGELNICLGPRSA